ncbi:hypothetical protein [Serratia fonticola]|uniref:hypothetical protein n=1 Tax=Serratia fonticola TaxID=47917 RepID=UPI00217B6464|nr:hypothetical protein [Serratia fonticola]CAI2037334.1 Uncharacterised protein [Serratia fonticola]
MKTKPIQLVHLYKHGQFLGYGLAADDVLLAQLVSTKITTSLGELACIEATFHLSSEMVVAPVRIDLESQDKAIK